MADGVKQKKTPKGLLIFIRIILSPSSVHPATVTASFISATLPLPAFIAPCFRLSLLHLRLALWLTIYLSLWLIFISYYSLVGLLNRVRIIFFNVPIFNPSVIIIFLSICISIKYISSFIAPVIISCLPIGVSSI